MSPAPRHLALAAIGALIPGVCGCSGSQPPATRYDQLVRCNAVTAIVGGALPPGFPNTADIRAATSRIAGALANEAAASGKTSLEVTNDIRSVARQIDADARTDDPDRKGKALVEEAERCVSLVPR